MIEILPTNAAGTQLEVRINNESKGTAFAPTGHVLVYGLGARTRSGCLRAPAACGVLVAAPAVIDGARRTTS